MNDRFNVEIEEEYTTESGDEILIPKTHKKEPRESKDILAPANRIILFSIIAFVCEFIGLFFFIFSSQATHIIGYICILLSFISSMVGAGFFIAKSLQKHEIVYDVKFYCVVASTLLTILSSAAMVMARIMFM